MSDNRPDEGQTVAALAVVSTLIVAFLLAVWVLL